jgi:hypothetical protein
LRNRKDAFFVDEAAFGGDALDDDEVGSGGVSEG